MVLDGCQIVIVWSSCNDTIVRRGEIVLDSDVIESWNKELETINDGKKGEPYLHTLLTHANKKVPLILDYSAINRRVNKLDINLNEMATLLQSNKSKRGISASYNPFSHSTLLSGS